MDLTTLENGWIHHRPLPPKPILITLDDGYADNYRAAYPVLMQYQLQVTIFITTGAVGRPNRLTWNEILTMDRGGRVQFGSHTVDHLDLRQLTVRQQQHEIQQSKADLEQHLGHPIIAFCFPSGRFNESTLQILQQSRYVFAVTTRPGYADDNQGPWTLHRVRVSGDE
ncbi:polysaccharide deacetylase family protein [Terrilactibacillus sp. S3-3]|nr:polysaccharide deacetylase family protein [Terrilactibacillus sp. S3-3]